MEKEIVKYSRFNKLKTKMSRGNITIPAKVRKALFHGEGNYDNLRLYWDEEDRAIVIKKVI